LQEALLIISKLFNYLFVTGDQAGHRPGLSGGPGHPECLLVAHMSDGDEGPARGVMEPPLLVLTAKLPGKSGFIGNDQELS
jgi:hypothetical protein